MRLIDFHTHFFPNKLMDALWQWFETHAWPIQYKQYAEDSIAILKSHGVTKCVSLHYPHKKDMAQSLNEWAYRLGQNHPDFIIPFGSVHPDDNDVTSILKTCFETYQFKGIKIHSHVQKVASDDVRMEPIYKICEEYNRIILIHCGTGPHFKEKPTDGYGFDVTQISGVKRFERIIKKYPNLKFIVPHLGFEEMDGFISLLKDYPNLYLDTAMAVGKYFPNEVKPEWLSENADRIVFGTDFPNIPYEWSREKDNILQMNLGKEKDDLIFYKNAEKLLGLPS